MVILSSKIGKAYQGSSSGFTLIEVLITLALIGIIAIAFLSAISTASMALITADERATAESLARSQMEYIKNPQEQPYDDINNPPEYIVLPDPEIPDGYNINIEAVRLDPEDDGIDDDDGIQKITVTVSRDDKEVITLEDYKRAS